MKTIKSIRSLPNNISEYSLTAEHILGKKSAIVALPQIDSSRHIWNPNDPRSFGPLGDNHLVQRKPGQIVPPNRKKLIVLFWKPVGPTSLLITQKLLNW